jgi:hypothetical protein
MFSHEGKTMKSVCRPMSHVLGGMLLAAVALTVTQASAQAQSTEAAAVQNAPSTLAPVVLGVPSVLSGNLVAGQAQGPAPAVRKDPLTAGLLSWLLPGVGSLYAGNSRHGVRHLVIEAGALVVTVIGAAQAVESVDCSGYYCTTDSGSWTLYLIGLGGMVGNSVWSIFTAVGDANTHNRAVAPGARQPGRVVGSLYIDPQIRVLGSQAAGTGTRTSFGFQVGRVAF